MKSNNSFLKKKKADERAKKREEKFKKRLEKNRGPKQDMDSMIAYVDKFGNITSTPPEEAPEEKKLPDEKLPDDNNN